MTSRTARCALGLVLFAAALAARAVTVEPLPGTTPQSTRLFAFFPNDAGVIVRDDAGNPMPGVSVAFDIPFSSTAGYAFFPDARDRMIVTTNAAGVAMPQPYNLMAAAVGDLTMTATALTSPQASTTFALTVLPGPAKTLAYIAGGNQWARVGATYALPWVVQAIGADGQPVPYTMVQFFAYPEDGVHPTGTFNGPNTLFVKADANGIATSPPFTADNVAGTFYGSASGTAEGNDPAPWLFFYYTNVALNSDTVNIVVQPLQSVAVGGVAGQFQLQVFNMFGPAVGSHYRIETDPACGAFYIAGYPTVVDGVSDAYGLISTPVFQGVARTPSCPVTITIENVANPINFPIQVFAYNTLVMTPQPASVTTSANTSFLIAMAFTDAGYPVAAAAVGPINITITPNRNGTTAQFLQSWIADFSTVYSTFYTNAKQGDYSIAFQPANGGPRVTVPISQRH